MGQDSKIEWCHATFNPWRGCTKVSAGCANCYADKLSKRNPGTLGVWGPEGTRVVAAESYWRQPIAWDREAAAAGERRRVFCASLADVGEDWRGPPLGSDGRRLYARHNAGGPYWVGCDQPLSDQDARRLAGSELTMQGVRDRIVRTFTPLAHLDLLLLTKRPGNLSRFFPAEFLSRCWVGASVEDARRKDRIDVLRTIPAAVRFLSLEPLLGDLGELDLAGIHWVIAGGESGPDARPMHPEWVQSVRDQCVAASVPFFFKQWGEWGPLAHVPGLFEQRTSPRVGPRLRWPWGINGIGAAGVVRVGKKAAGRLLDGRVHSEFPAAYNLRTEAPANA
jgi:protein gp37